MSKRRLLRIIRREIARRVPDQYGEFHFAGDSSNFAKAIRAHSADVAAAVQKAIREGNPRSVP
jgi:hypothetical protein